MFPHARRKFRALSSLVALALGGCVDQARRLDGSNAVVEVIETPPPVEVTAPPPSGSAVFAGPTLIYVEPLPSPVRHVVSVRLEPAMTKLDDVQSVEVDVRIEGGVVGDRKIHAVFVSPQGFAWERQAAVITSRAGESATAHFSLPVAATFIADQRLAGTWQITTLDEGVEQASATFALEE